MNYKYQRYIVLVIAILIIGFGVWHCCFNPDGPKLLGAGEKTDVDEVVKQFADGTDD